MGCMGAPYVRLGTRSCGGRSFFGYDNVYCCADRGKNSQLDSDDVGRQFAVHSGDDVFYFTGVNVYNRWVVRRHALGRPG